MGTELSRKKCGPCDAKTPPLEPKRIQELSREVPEWELSSDGKRISRAWVVKDFPAGMEFFARVGEVAEEEGHHPDLHLTDYRNVRVELTTHAIDALSENDFIVAAKIDQIPVSGVGRSSTSCRSGTPSRPA
jgi:4a-hydroxytetrahydrobiopterin dehydratase